MKRIILFQAAENKSWKILLSICLFIIFANGHQLSAQSDLDALSQRKRSWLYFVDSENSLYHHLSSEARELLKKRKEQVSKIQTLTEWQNRQEFLRTRLLEVMGPFPEKTPLNAKILRTVDKGSYKIEHIVFESRPGFFVTSSLFMQKKRKGKSPVVIYCSGHSAEGYRSSAYMHIIVNLVNKGFIVFAFDPVGQGERLEYFDPATGKSIVGGATKEHSYPGAQAFITGDSQAGYMTWDGIRAVDYLLTRKEVDPARIGITGRSGGGTQSAYISAVDERIYASAPECYITNLTRLFQSIGPQDAEQNLFNGISEGLDHADYLAVRAPKPALMITTTNDFFNIQGARETAREVSEIYKAYNKPENFGMVEDINVHASTQKNREAMYAFFQKHLNNPGDPVDEEVELPSNDEIRVTPGGQISTSLNSETVFSLNRKEAEKLQLKLESLRNTGDSYKREVLNSAKKLSGYIEANDIDEPVMTGNIQKNGYMIDKYFISGEGNYPVPYLIFTPENPNNKAIIYLHPSGKNTEAEEGGEIEWLVNQGYTVLAPDMAGTGETGPGIYQGDAYIENVSYNIWFASMLIGRSITGIRAGDVNKLVRILEKYVKPSEISCIAKKELSPVLLHSALFTPSISRIILIEPYSSYRSIVMSRFYKPEFIHSTVPGALKAYDLPDLAANLAPKKLLMINVTDGKGEISDRTMIDEDISVIKSQYGLRNVADNLKILSGQNEYQIRNELLNWLK